MERKKWKKSFMARARIGDFIRVLVFVMVMAGVITFLTASQNEKYATGLEACVDCHEEITTAFKDNVHFIGKADCADCHGSAAKHIDSGGEKNTILSFKGNTGLQNVKQCFVCHRDTSVQYMSGSHHKASLACTDCHGIHKTGQRRALLQTPAGKLCSGCHPEIKAQFKLNERHRLQEGILECISCHNAHKPSTRERLGGFKQQECLQCHRDKGGPFIFEHEGLTVEGCSVCHDVHGSPNRHMLKSQSVGDLCFSCHAAAPAWHRGFKTTDTNCSGCHTSIHGSNLDPLFLK